MIFGEERFLWQIIISPRVNCCDQDWSQVTSQDVTCQVSPPPRHPGGILSHHTTPHHIPQQHCTTPIGFMINHIWDHTTLTPALRHPLGQQMLWLAVQYSNITKTVHLLNTTNRREDKLERIPHPPLLLSLSLFTGYLCSNAT